MPTQLSIERPFRRMATQVGTMMDQLAKGYYNFCPSETWTPDVNLCETDEAYLVCVDLAGVRKEDIHLEVADGRLTLRGHRPVPSHIKASRAVARGCKARIHLMEIDHGPFVRQVELPKDVVAAKITATYRSGMLWIELPKTAAGVTHAAPRSGRKQRPAAGSKD